MLRHVPAAFAILVTAAPCIAQTINIDFGLPGSCPPSTYGGAGAPGVWNCIEAWHTSISSPQFVYQLVDVNGNPTGVTLHQYGGQELLSARDGSVTGDDAILMNDAIITHFALLETCLFIDGLPNGTYEVITYAWRPNHPETMSRVRHDQSPIIVDIGGAWPGHHVEGVTYARHVLEVTTGVLWSHSGNPPGAPLAIGAAMNGMQIRPFVPSPTGDLNGDGVVNTLDLGILLAAWSIPAGTPACGGAPGPCAPDLNQDGQVNSLDLGILLPNWTL